MTGLRTLASTTPLSESEREEIAARGGPTTQSETDRVQRARIQILQAPWAWSDRSLRAVERSIPWERWEADRDLLRARLLEARTERSWSGSSSD